MRAISSAVCIMYVFVNQTVYIWVRQKIYLKSQRFHRPLYVNGRAIAFKNVNNEKEEAMNAESCVRRRNVYQVRDRRIACTS